MRQVLLVLHRDVFRVPGVACVRPVPNVEVDPVRVVPNPRVVVVAVVVVRAYGALSPLKHMQE